MKRFYLIFVMIFAVSAGAFCEIYKANAEASFYADKFHGRKTANGEIFNMYDYTAAHKTLPFNTILKVTNIANGKSVTVRVNDRGPFVQGREIDLSKAAAQKLDMIGDGTAQVSIEILQLGAETKISSVTAAKAGASAQSQSAGPEPKTTAPAKTAPSSSSSVTEEVAVLIPQTEVEEKLRWDIQVGSFGEKANAEALAQKLLRAGFKNVVYQKAGGITRVVIRDLGTNEVQPVLNRLEEKGFKDYLVKRRNQS
ncbi:MAG: septal ring lytic transglycosylase RlpA family protein [Treponema sp.]|nr:septal ring lytic transglycosylase RlpA family protein [Treponema sp.]